MGEAFLRMRLADQRRALAALASDPQLSGLRRYNFSDNPGYISYTWPLCSTPWPTPCAGWRRHWSTWRCGACPHCSTLAAFPGAPSWTT